MCIYMYVELYTFTHDVYVMTQVIMFPIVFWYILAIHLFVDQQSLFCARDFDISYDTQCLNETCTITFVIYAVKVNN